MPAWGEARHAGRSARDREAADRAGDSSGDHQVRRIQRAECYYCGGKKGLRWMLVEPKLEAMVCKKCR